MKTRLQSLLAIVLIVVISACSNDDDTPKQPTTDYTTAEALLEASGFQGSILIRKGNTDFLRKGFGMADVQAGAANDPALIYRIGSMTKAFTAMGLVSLKRDGLIESFDQPLSDFDNEFPHGDKITLRHMLTHYSGLPDYIGPIENAVKNANQHFAPEDIYDIIKESAGEDGTLFEPGAQFSYSNSNYLILGLLIEELTNMDYHDYLQQKIFDPLGLQSTTVGEDAIGGESYARGYRNAIEVAPYPMELAFGAGALVSTITDLEKWGDALMGGGFLTGAEKAEVFAAPYTEDDLFTVGMGWFTIKQEGTIVYNHGGNIDGFTSIMALLPETNSMIIMLSNAENWDSINQVLETLIINEF